MEYDFKKAEAIITSLNNLGVLLSASMGLHEDWLWTSEEVWNETEGFRENFKNQQVAFLTGSRWATPVIRVEFTDGSDKYFSCHTGEHKLDLIQRLNEQFNWTQGPISSTLGLRRLDLVLEEFEFNKS